MMHQQMSFELPVREALGREDFFISPANANAVAMIETWHQWPARKMLLTGPSGAGKTHLAHVWANLSGARIIGAQELRDLSVPALCRGPLAVEDCDRVAGDARGERALFHLHNLLLAEGYALLLTAERPARAWELALPDLISRMQAMPVVALSAPDDALLKAVLMKLFTDRQIMPTPGTIPFLARRMERSFDAARQIVAALDAAALASGRPVNRRLAAEVLDNPAR